MHFDRFAVNATPALGAIPIAPAQYTGAFSASMTQGAVAAPTAAAAATAFDLPGLAGANFNLARGIPGLPLPGAGASGTAGGTALAGGTPSTASPYVLMRPQQPSPYVQQAMQRNALLQQQQFANPTHVPSYQQRLGTSQPRHEHRPQLAAPATNALHSGRSTISPLVRPASAHSSSAHSSHASPVGTAAAAYPVDASARIQRSLSTVSAASALSAGSHASRASSASGASRASRTSGRARVRQGEREPAFLPPPPPAATVAASLCPPHLHAGQRRTNARPGRIDLSRTSFQLMPYGAQPPGRVNAPLPPGVGTPGGGVPMDAIATTPHAHLPLHLLSPGVAFGSQATRLMPGLPLTPGVPTFNPYINQAPGAPLHFPVHPGTPSAHMPFYMGIPTPMDPATPHWPAPPTPHWGMQMVPLATHALTSRPTPGPVPQQNTAAAPHAPHSSEGYPFPVVPSPSRADHEPEPDLHSGLHPEPGSESIAPQVSDRKADPGEPAVLDTEEDGLGSPTVKYAFGQRRASTNSPAVSPMVERRGYGLFPPGPAPSTPHGERDRSLSLSHPVRAPRSQLATEASKVSPTAEVEAEVTRGHDPSADVTRTSAPSTATSAATPTTEELTKAIALMSVRGTALAKAKAQRHSPAPSHTNAKAKEKEDKKPQRLPAPMSVPLADLSPSPSVAERRGMGLSLAHSFVNSPTAS